MKYIFSLFAVVVLFANRTLAQTGDWLTQTDTTYHFSFKYPGDWQLKLPGTATRFFVTSYPETDADKFRENINCIVRKIDVADFKIQTAEEAVLKSLSSQLDDFKLIRTDYVKWNDADAMQLEYTATKKSGDIMYNLHMYQQMAIVKGTLFTLTYSSEAKSYEKYIATINKIVESIKVD